jgi:tetratricopeptide (TPR) repeat protein
MLNYLDGKLSGKEKYNVEVHLESCELCKDEFEGLKSMTNRNKLPDIVSDLNLKISMITHKRKKHALFPQVSAMAAIVLLLVGFAWFFFYIIHLSPQSLGKKEMAQALEAQKEKEEIQKFMDDNKVDPNVKIDIPLKKAETKESSPFAPIVEENSKIPEITNSELNRIKEDVVTDNLRKEEEQKKVNSEVSNNLLAGNIQDKTDDKVVSSGDVQDEDFSLVGSESMEKKDRSKTKKSPVNKAEVPAVAPSAMELALAEYNKHNYKSAIEILLKDEKSIGNKEELYYYLGMSYQKINKDNKAIPYYDKIIINPKSQYYENALWNKSQILIKSGDNKNAISNLNLIISIKGKNTNQAKSQLDSLLDK